MRILKIENGKIQYDPRPITHEELQRDLNYFVADKITKKMLKEGLITQDEYKQIRKFNIKTYKPFLYLLMLDEYSGNYLH